MKTIIVLCPTLRRALNEWHRLADTYPDMWINVRRKPMSLTSKYGVKYIFFSENEPEKIRGLYGDIVSIDDISLFEQTESEGEK